LDRAESAAESYKKVEAEILSLPDAEVGRVTADVAQAGSIALGALPNLLKLRAEFEQLDAKGKFTAALDKLQDLALAAIYAHVRSTETISDKEVPGLIERASPIRENLLYTAQALVGFKVFAAEPVAAIREGKGNLDTAKDLVALATLFNANWDLVASKVPFERTVLEEAAQLGAQLLHAIGAREVGEVRKDPSFDWLDLRARAFRLLVNNYEELRRAAVFVRWHEGDGAAFAPSLHSTKPRRRRRVTEEVVAGDEEESALGSESRVAPSANIDPGMPGASPFQA
jgi:hypothetical protein